MLCPIYQTSTQKIPIETQNYEWSSYDKYSPTNPDQFNQPQVIINSDRLVFNAKTDHVLISGEKSIFLGANYSLNFNAGSKVVIECLDIKLGDKTATEPLIKGDIFLMQLELVMKKIDILCDALKSVKDWPNKTSPDGITNPALQIAIKGLSSVITNEQDSGFLDTIEDYKSKVSKTK